MFILIVVGMSSGLLCMRISLVVFFVTFVLVPMVMLTSVVASAGVSFMLSLTIVIKELCCCRLRMMLVLFCGSNLVSIWEMLTSVAILLVVCSLLLVSSQISILFCCKCSIVVLMWESLGGC